ncbi:MAG: molybdopterin-dependent oxidoreductase [Halobacteriota archaeon]
MGPEEFITRRVSFRCNSGRVTAGTWEGLPIRWFLQRVTVPDTTTHVLIEAADGHRACVGLLEAIDALLAFEGRRDDTGARDTGVPRFVGPNIAAPRAVRRVETIDAITLRSGDDPTRLEHLVG